MPLKYGKRLSLFILVFFTTSLATAVAKAEYRVFVLKIQKSEQDFRLVESTLDPLQYPYYYQVEAGETITYTDTWRCKGRTSGFAPHCPNPKALPRADSSNEPLN